MDRPPDDAYEQDPETRRKRYGSPPWWEESSRPTPELERVRNRQRAEAWRDGHGKDAHILVRADVARALAEIAYGVADVLGRPVDDVWLDEVANHVLASMLGVDRPTGDSPLSEGPG